MRSHVSCDFDIGSLADELTSADGAELAELDAHGNVDIESSKASSGAHRARERAHTDLGSWLLVPKNHLLIGRGHPTDICKLTGSLAVCFRA